MGTAVSRPYVTCVLCGRLFVWVSYQGRKKYCPACKDMRNRDIKRRSDQAYRLRQKQKVVGQGLG